MTLSDYTIHCTKEQTKKAFELGAPIYTTNEHLYRHPHEYKYWIEVDIQGNSYSAKIPTAEEMVGWFRSKNIHIVIHKDVVDKWSTYGHEIEPIEFTVFDLLTGYNSFEEATLAAIDAALDYLSNKQ